MMSEDFKFYTEEARTTSQLSRDLQDLIKQIQNIEAKLITLSSSKDIAILEYKRKRIELQELEKCHSKS